MEVGTKSLLFGVHAFWYHPVTVWRAFRALYHRSPSFWETVAIVVHDWGYWGKADMDGDEGKRHPLAGAKLIHRLWWATHRRRRIEAMDWFFYVVKHSRFMSAKMLVEPSELCWADKASVFFEAPWFYLLRARLSGEIKEYRRNAEPRVSPEASDKVWFAWLCGKTARDLRGKFRNSWVLCTVKKPLAIQPAL